MCSGLRYYRLAPGLREKWRINMLLKIKKAFKYTVSRDTSFWKGSFYGLLFITGVAFIGLSLGMPTGLSVWFDIPVITLIGLLIVTLGSIVTALILALVRLPIPRLFVGGLISVYFLLSFSLTEFNMNYLGAAFISGVLIALGFLLGSSIYMVVRNKGYEWFTYAYTGTVFFLFIWGLAWLLSPGEEFYPSIRSVDYNSKSSLEIAVDDPSLEGKYKVNAFSYGSGEDLHRDEFAAEVDYITETVDASGFLSDWHILRNIFWGFDEKDIPLNGRVWMPEGPGPFPLVLMVHGSHKMEHFSDEGYDYLGELLASRGFTAVSVGEDFINFSIWSEGIDWDMTMRAWVLIQHLIMIEKANEIKDSPFWGKVDMNNIALIGHSRGGQAAALAAEFDQFFNENNHEEISLDFDFKIKAVAAIAPIDRLVEDEFIRMNNVDYFTIQGSQDSDVNTFYGDRLYRRTTFRGDDYGFKASLYVEGANHGQFNTVWGDKDTTMPTALLLNKEEMISGEEQRKIAKIYISAFLEASLHGNQDYLPILRDYRTALKWLPATTYLNQFHDSDFTEVSDYEDDRNRETTSLSGGNLSGQQLKTWEEQDVKSRTNHSTHNRAVYLDWKGQIPASYTLELPEDFAVKEELNQESLFVFSIANADIGRIRAYNQEPKITIEMTTHDGVSVKYPLSHFRSYPPVIHSRFTKLGVFERAVKVGNLGNSSEPVFQMYEIALSDFIAKDEAFDPGKLYKIKFRFEQGTAGKVFVDDIGFNP
jgi:hypothetical protein